MNNKIYLLQDIGNTNTKLTIYKDYEFEDVLTISTKKTNAKQKYKLIKKIIENNNIDEVIYSLRFENENDLYLMDKLNKKFKDIKFKSSYIAMIQDNESFVKEITSNSIGTDIYLGVKGAEKLNDKAKNFMVIDLGTATTYTLVLNNKITGVNIAPGFISSIKNLLEEIGIDEIYLEEVALGETSSILESTSTLKALINGSQQGFLDNLVSTIAKYIKEFKLDSIYVTGGDSYIALDSIAFNDKKWNVEIELVNIGLMSLAK